MSYYSKFPSLLVGGGVVPPNLGLVTGAWSGDLTDTTFTGSAYFDDTYTECRLAASINPDLSDPVYGDIVAISSGLAKMEITGLDPDTQYYWGVEVDGQLDGGKFGRFKTLPSADSFAYKFAAFCCTNGAPISTVYAAIEQEDLLVTFHEGDLHYRDITSTNVSNHIAGLTDRMADPVLGSLMRRFPMLYMYDDHDSAGNDSNSTSAGMPASVEAYRAVVPHPPTAENDNLTDAPYFAKIIGDICHIVLDCRSRRVLGSGSTDPAATMLGSVQKQWLKDTLVDSLYDGKAFIIHSSIHWNGNPPGNGDGWPYFNVERAELAEYMKANGLQNRVAIIFGDAHGLSGDTGYYADYATGGGMSIPVFGIGSLDSNPGTKGGSYSLGTYPGKDQYGLFEVLPNEDGTVTINFTGKNSELGTIVSHSFILNKYSAVPTGVLPLWRLGFFEGMVAEDTTASTVIADLITPEWATSGEVVYTKQADPDNKFTVTDDTLVLSDTLTDDEEYTVVVRATYPSGLFIDEIITVHGALASSSSGTAIDLSYLDTSGNSNALSTYTYSSVSFGTEASDRDIVVLIGFNGQNGDRDIDTESVTIGGITATRAASHLLPGYSGDEANATLTLFGLAMYVARVPAGTSGTVVVNMTGTAQRASIATYRMIGAANTTPEHVSKASRRSSAPPVGVMIPKIPGGVTIGFEGYRVSNRARMAWASEVVTNGGLSEIIGEISGDAISWTGLPSDFSRQMAASGTGYGQHLLAASWSPSA